MPILIRAGITILPAFLLFSSLLLGAPASAEECFCGDGNTPTLGCCGGDGQRPCVLASFSLFSDCTSTCNPGNVQTATTFCATPRVSGESCGPAAPCADGHTCWPGNFTCYPDSGSNPIPADECLELHEPTLHQALIGGYLSTPVGGLFIGQNGEAVSWGIGDKYTDLGVEKSTESGVIYGSDGSFGCYVTQCEGLDSDLGAVGLFAAETVYDSYTDAQGTSQVATNAGELVVEVSNVAVLSGGGTCTADGFDFDGLSEADLIGSGITVGVGIGLSPVGLGCATCTTTVSTAIPADRPVAECIDFEASPQQCVSLPGLSGGVCSRTGDACDSSSDCPDTQDQFAFCAEPTTCKATITADDVDDGSYDSNGTLVSRTLSPAGPFPVASDDLFASLFSAFNNPVTLTVTNDEDNSDSCEAVVWPVDCQPPVVVGCPEPVTVECEGPVPVKYGTPLPGASIVPPAATDATDNCVALDGIGGPGIGAGKVLDLAALGYADANGEVAFTLGTTPLAIGAFDGFNLALCGRTTEPGGAECDDGIDNDDDGLTDFGPGGDPECSAPGAVSESPRNVDDFLNDPYIVGDSSVTVVDSLAPSLSCPANVTTACEGNGSANVSFATPTASDVCEGATTASCNKPSGSAFSLGSTTVTCESSDSSGNTGSCSFDVTVTDPAPPTISCPADIVTECTSAAGAAVSFAAGASDTCSAVDGPNCSRTSGSTFALGSEPVTCSASDTAGNSASCSFGVQVRDTQAPTLAVRGVVGPIECGIGSFVDPGASVVDTCDASVDGSIVTGTGVVDTTTVGSYLVGYAVSDASGNAAAPVDRTVSVVDTTPPSIECSADITVEPVAPSGTQVSFSAATFSDACDTNLPTPTCPASGSVFAVGSDTGVSCSVTDATGLSSSCNLRVKVLSELELVDSLGDQVGVLNDAGSLTRGQNRALNRHVETIRSSISRNDVVAACDQISGWIHQLGELAAEGEITSEEAAPLIESGANLGATLACPMP